MSQIHALEAIYHSNHDRMLFTLVMTDNKEHKFWLTRRYSKLLLNAIDQLIKTGPSAPNATAEAFIIKPSPSEMILAANLTARAGDETSLFLGIFDEEHCGIEISGPKSLYNSLQTLINETLKQTEWDL